MTSRERLEPAIGIGAILFDVEGRVLLIQRGQPPDEGYWSVPGGKQEAGETMVQACRREVREETGLEIVVGPIVAVAERRGKGFHYVIIDFLARPSENNPDSAPRPAGDARDALWVDVQDLDAYPVVEGLTRVIVRAAANLRAPGSAGLVDADGMASDFLPP